MISDHYPPLSGCDKYGMAGNCGPDCPAFIEGDCPEEDEIVDGWLVTCHDAVGSDLEEGKEYRLETKPTGEFVVIEGKEYLACRFWIEPIIEEARNG